MLDGLKPCPFCGGRAFVDAVFHEERPYFKWYAHVLCYNCQASAGPTGFSESEDKAMEKAALAWNHRV